ncbi:hypothetical protein EV207_103165 [Scopulibacillus darangshiensis]|uniref:Uncharacterized protein n=1 Tax=Scopulibacillus darangshiensis TaxID=442528 RepID=A0A4R2PAZ6_9BACL|nr:hypothetical protein [Scopulibacillus darangshiensis]TCP31281.1 hypothetical protein EV207_103165 [Scopulibacillus darangshiensis]
MGKKKKKNKDLGPKRKRLKREARLKQARIWVDNYEGKNIIKGYRNWFAVDLECALKELEMVGYPVSIKQKEYVKRATAERQRERQLRKERRDAHKQALLDDDWSDETFAFIAGYTPGGAPFGITHEEIEREEKRAEEELQKEIREWEKDFADCDDKDNGSLDKNKDKDLDVSDEDLPF